MYHPPLALHKDPDMTNPMLLHAGFDGLDMAYNTQIGPDLHTALSAAKAVANDERRAQPVSFGGHDFLVEGHGGKGGYTFAVNTGEFGALWWFKEPCARGDPWGVKVSCRALSLAVHGLDAVKASADQFLTDLGVAFTEVDRRISRIDYAIDLLVPGFEIRPENFVCHARRSKALDGTFSATQRGTAYQGIRIGKLPNTQVCIYDKRREVLDKRKAFWWDIWAKQADKHGVALTKHSDIWRFEFRSGGDGISRMLKRRTWECFSQNPTLLFQKIAAQARLVDPTEDSNRTRWPNTPEWDACQAVIDKISVDQAADVDAQKIADQLRVEYLRTLEKQTVGLIVSQVCAYGLGVADMPAMFEQVRLDVDEALALKGEEADGALARRAAEIDTRFSR